MTERKYAVNQTVIGNVLIVTYDDGSCKGFNAIALGVEWFCMTNDAFFDKYGFNFVPAQQGLYDVCRRLAGKG